MFSTPSKKGKKLTFIQASRIRSANFLRATGSELRASRMSLWLDQRKKILTFANKQASENDGKADMTGISSNVLSVRLRASKSSGLADVVGHGEVDAI